MSADILIDSGLYHTCGNWYLNFHSSPTTFFFNKLFYSTGNETFRDSF